MIVHCVYELCYILIISIFGFLIFIHFTNQITLKPSLAQKLKHIQIYHNNGIDKCSTLDPHGTKDEERMEKLLEGAIPLL